MLFSFVYVPSTSDFFHARPTFYWKFYIFSSRCLTYFFFSFIYLCYIEKSPNSNNLTFCSTWTSPCTFSQGVSVSQYNWCDFNVTPFIAVTKVCPSEWDERTKKEKKNCVSLLTNYSRVGFCPCLYTQGQRTIAGFNQLYPGCMDTLPSGCLWDLVRAHKLSKTCKAHLSVILSPSRTPSITYFLSKQHYVISYVYVHLLYSNLWMLTIVINILFTAWCTAFFK